MLKRLPAIIGALIGVCLVRSVLYNSGASVRAIRQASDEFKAEMDKLVLQGRLLEAHMSGCRRCQRGRKCSMRLAMTESFLGTARA